MKKYLTNLKSDGKAQAKDLLRSPHAAGFLYVNGTSIADWDFLSKAREPSTVRLLSVQ